MRKIREMLRLHYDCDLSQRAIAKSIGVARSTVGDLFVRFKSTGLSWPLPEDLDDAQLEACMYPGKCHFTHRRPEPDWNEIHRELRNKEVTLHLLWLEYREGHPDGYQYSQFCHRYRTWRGKVDVTMRQRHRAGEKMFVDYAGLTMFVIDPDTGEKQPVQIFVATLGASNYTYAEACWSQNQESFIGANCRAVEFFEGVPEVVIPDNLKSAVRAVDRYEPDINPTYLDWAQHYGTVVIPARPGRPRDKAKVEKSVQIVEQWVLAPLRKRRFFRLGELNAAIWDLLFALNQRPFQKMEGSRRSWFESVDRPALRPLPTKRYEFATYKFAKVNIDYHIEVQRNYYSVPHHLVRQSVEVRISAGTVEILHRGRRVASHKRLRRRGQFSTDVAHMPQEHKYWAKQTPEWLIRQGEAVGPRTSELLQSILQKRPHPQQGFRTCMGILRLARSYPDTRMEAAAERALRLGVCSYRSLQSILAKGLDQVPLQPRPELPPTPHENVRGASYFNVKGV